MPSLRELQAGIAHHLLTGEPTPAEASIVADGFAARERLGVYRNNVRESLTGALAAIYPAVERLVGVDFFAQAARAYLPAHPSRSANLHEFGDRFPGFLADLPGARDLAYLPDVARLEWAWHRAFHAADQPPFDVPALAAVAPERHPELRFRVHPSVSLLESPWPFVRIWETNVGDAPELARIDLDAGAEHALVRRPALEVLVERIPPGEHALLGALGAGAPLAEALERALERSPGHPVDDVIARRIADGTITGFELTGFASVNGRGARALTED